MNFNEIKYVTIKLFLITIISGCGTNNVIPSIEEMQFENSSTQSDGRTDKKYQVTGQYIDHRKQQQILTTPEGNIAFLDFGQGSTIVMLHGIPTSSWLYRNMIVSLQKDHRVIAIDLLGFGSSDKPKSTEVNYLPISQAKYVEKVLAQQGVDDYTLMFHDMGGLVAWEMLDRHLNGLTKIKIENLIVLNTIIDKHGFNHPKIKKGLTARIMSQSFTNQLSSSTALDMTFDNMGLTSNVSLSENICNGYVIPMQEGNGDVLYDFYTSFDEARFTRLEEQVAQLSKFDGEVLVLWGAEDTVLTTKQIPVLQKTAEIEAENIHVFNNNAHFLPEEIPEKLNQHIRAFLH